MATLNPSISQTEKHRMFLLDIMRCLCALQIFLGHSINMYGCSYGAFPDGLISWLTAPVMTCFFILSGFSIHYQHRVDASSVSGATTGSWTRGFLKNRLIAIMPSYLLVALIWPLAYPEQLREWFLLLPADLFGVQTSYNSIFGITHNGGTWFVSCLLLAYILYPVMRAILSSKKRWIPVIMLICGQFYLVYSLVLIPRFPISDLYSNPIVRSVEFMVGVAFAEILFRERPEDAPAKKWGAGVFLSRIWNGLRTPVGTALCLIVWTFGVGYIGARINGVGYLDTLFGYVHVPLILLVMLVGACIRCRPLEKSRILSALSGMSYQFFLMQLFLWKLSDLVLGLFGWEGNAIRIAVSFCLCLGCSFLVWFFYDRPVRRLLKKRL